jgi:hypothetical protein
MTLVWSWLFAECWLEWAESHAALFLICQVMTLVWSWLFAECWLEWAELFWIERCVFSVGFLDFIDLTNVNVTTFLFKLGQTWSFSSCYFIRGF